MVESRGRHGVEALGIRAHDGFIRHVTDIVIGGSTTAPLGIDFFAIRLYLWDGSSVHARSVWVKGSGETREVSHRHGIQSSLITLETGQPWHIGLGKRLSVSGGKLSV